MPMGWLRQHPNTGSGVPMRSPTLRKHWVDPLASKSRVDGLMQQLNGIGSDAPTKLRSRGLIRTIPRTF